MNTVRANRTFVKSNGSDSLTVALLLRVTRATLSNRSLEKSDWAKSDGSDSLYWHKKGKTVKNIRKIRFFERIARFWEQFAQIMHLRITEVALFKRNRERFALVALLKRATTAIRSRSLFFKVWWGRFAHGRSFLKSESAKIERVNSQLSLWFLNLHSIPRCTDFFILNNS